ncbi:MAG: succinate dehydrogenase [Chloroflexota bacterium]|nr:succinate dehydrogenase [Chloroflexota bacterium]
MAVGTAQGKEAGRAPLALNSRSDMWWIRPVLTVIVLGAFVVYSTFRAFQNQYYEVGPYLSPFYSPLVPLGWSIFGWNISPAIYILVFPLSFRLTCYYYRLAYYRAFFWDPPACAVPEPSARKRYTGERRFPFVLQNIHRYAFYAAVIFIFILAYDAIQAFFFADGFHVGVGSLLLTANVVLISLYTFSCHSFRHLVGGRVNCYSCTLGSRTRYGVWKQVSFLNGRHALFAWSSLISVGLVDLYVMLVSSGTITDLRLF